MLIICKVMDSMVFFFFSFFFFLFSKSVVIYHIYYYHTYIIVTTFADLEPKSKRTNLFTMLLLLTLGQQIENIMQDMHENTLLCNKQKKQDHKKIIWSINDHPIVLAVFEKILVRQYLKDYHQQHWKSERSS